VLGNQEYKGMPVPAISIRNDKLRRSSRKLRRSSRISKPIEKFVTRFPAVRHRISKYAAHQNNTSWTAPSPRSLQKSSSLNKNVIPRIQQAAAATAAVATAAEEEEEEEEEEEDEEDEEETVDEWTYCYGSYDFNVPKNLLYWECLTHDGWTAYSVSDANNLTQVCNPTATRNLSLG
jgi:hypothetical protein